jgi:hypothetical protein
MALSTIEGTANLSKEKESKKKGGRRVTLPGKLRSIAEEIHQAEELTARLVHKHIASHERVRALANSASGGAFTPLLKKSPLLSKDDREFLHSLKYI